MISMAIKYVVLPEKKTVIAILPNTQYDAYNKAMKICRELSQGQTKVYICPNLEKMLMPNEFKVTVVCDNDDEFDVTEGKRIAKSRCLDNYYRSFDKRINAFKESIGIISKRYNVQNYGVNDCDNF